MKLQEAVRKETTLMTLGCAICLVVMVVAFAVLHGFFPDKVPFDYRVFVGGILGTTVAAGNFLWMAITVQKVSAAEDDDRAKSIMRTSYRYRNIGQLAWGILAIFVPFVNAAAGIIPLFFPGIVIKIRGIVTAIRGGAKTEV